MQPISIFISNSKRTSRADAKENGTLYKLDRGVYILRPVTGSLCMDQCPKSLTLPLPISGSFESGSIYATAGREFQNCELCLYLYGMVSIACAYECSKHIPYSLIHVQVCICYRFVAVFIYYIVVIEWTFQDFCHSDSYTEKKNFNAFSRIRLETKSRYRRTMLLWNWNQQFPFGLFPER